jgi:prepilin-type N-terminal cleavage/methylation domain-containing protein
MIKNAIKNEQGLSLVEVLIAVTIMSVISVSIMSYFVSAAEKSSDQSRRVIAANFARLKAAEVRKFFADPDITVPSASGVPLYVPFAATAGGRKLVVTSNAVFANLDSAFRDLFTNLDAASPYKHLFDAEPELNGTVYRYRVEFDDTADTAHDELAVDMGSPSAPGIPVNFLIKTTITVYWTASDVQPAEKPASKFSTSVVTYILKRGE